MSVGSRNPTKSSKHPLRQEADLHHAIDSGKAVEVALSSYTSWQSPVVMILKNNAMRVNNGVRDNFAVAMAPTTFHFV